MAQPLRRRLARASSPATSSVFVARGPRPGRRRSATRCAASSAVERRRASASRAGRRAGRRPRRCARTGSTAPRSPSASRRCSRPRAVTAGASGSSSPTCSRSGVFFDSGIVDGLRERARRRLGARVPRVRRGGREWAQRARETRSCYASGARAGSRRRRRARARGGSTACSTGSSATTRSRSGSTCRHGFHRERMRAGPPELDARLGARRPAAALGARSSARCSAGTSARAATCPRALSSGCARECAALVLANVQPHAVVPFLAAARRLGLPVVALRRELGPHRRQGRDLAALRRYVVQNEVMRGRSRALPRHRPGARRRHAAGRRRTSSRARARARSTRRSSARYGLDPVASARRSSWGTRRRTRRTRAGSSSGSSTGGEDGAARALPAPLPAASARHASGASASRARSGDRRASHVQEPSFTDLEELATLLQHVRLRRRERGDDPARRARQRPPGRLRPLRRGRSAGRALGGEERHRRALRGARRVGRLLPRGRASTRSCAGSSGRWPHPASSRRARGASSREVVGEVDGRAAERVVDAIVRTVAPASDSSRGERRAAHRRREDEGRRYGQHEVEVGEESEGVQETTPNAASARATSVAALAVGGTRCRPDRGGSTSRAAETSERVG